MSSVAEGSSTMKPLETQDHIEVEGFETAPIVADQHSISAPESSEQDQQESQQLIHSPAKQIETTDKEEPIIPDTVIKQESEDIAMHDDDQLESNLVIPEETKVSPKTEPEELPTESTKEEEENLVKSPSPTKSTTESITDAPPPIQPKLEQQVEPIIKTESPVEEPEKSPPLPIGESIKSPQSPLKTEPKEPNVPSVPTEPKELTGNDNDHIESKLDSSLNDIPEELSTEKLGALKEEEAETVHLHQSPQHSLDKKNSFSESNINGNIKGDISPFQTNSLAKSNHNIKIEELDSLLDEQAEHQEQKIQAYAMLDFEAFTFYVQTMQILLGRMVEGDSLTDALDIHLGNQKAISRRHAKIFYNFGNQRFELSILGRNGAFVEGNYVEKGVTVPLLDGNKIQIGETEFTFVLPKREGHVEEEVNTKELEKQASILQIQNEPMVVPKAEDIHLENIDKLVANFDDIKKDIESDKSLLPNPHVLGGLLDDDHEKRELEIEQEIGRVLAREHSEQATDHDDFNNDKKSKKKSISKGKPEVDGKAKPKRQTKAKKKVYTLEEIPVEYRNKPNLPYSVLITDCLRKRGTDRGMSLSEIYKGIQELYPYYFYCPDGWQSSVRHNLSLNKSFKKISKEGKGWLWGVNEEVIAEKDRARQKQLENAKAKGKLSAKALPRTVMSNLQTFPLVENRGSNLHNPIQITNYTIPNQHHQTQQQLQHTQQLQNRAPQTSTLPRTQPPLNIQQQNMPIKQDVSTPVKPAVSSGTTGKPDMNSNTKRALAYLQKELISLTKSRKMYDRATSTEILTKALAMTISQVDQAAKNFAIKGFPLVTLIDKNPGHVTKILTAALNAATLQVCKQKGLTPHLPPKTPAAATTASTTVKPITASVNSGSNQGTATTTSTMKSDSHVKPMAKSVGDGPISTKLNNNAGSQPIVNKLKIIPQQPGLAMKPKEVAKPAFAPKPAYKPASIGKGPMVYQFSKSNTPTDQGNSVVDVPASTTKPQFKPPSVGKPAFKPAGPISLTSNTNIKPVKLNSNDGAGVGVTNVGVPGNLGTAGITKPQFYPKAKNVSTVYAAEDKDVSVSRDGDGDDEEDDGSDMSDADGELDMMLADLEKDVESSDEEGEQRKRSVSEMESGDVKESSEKKMRTE